MQLLMDPVSNPWENHFSLYFEAGLISGLQDLGLYKNNKEFMTEEDFEKISLKN